MEDCIPIASNIQIKNQKLTIGELDVLFLHLGNPIHLEIIYKFYLYDPKIKGDFLHRWIGPNRKDILVYKLHKLKEKQLPLLYSTKYTKPILDTLNLSVADIRQNVLYKAQLFLPYAVGVDISPLNQECVYGFYFNIDTLPTFQDYQFYIPSKLDWLIEPHKDVEWLNYNEAKCSINKYIKELRSPMLWLRDKNETISKCFVTFW